MSETITREEALRELARRELARREGQALAPKPPNPVQRVVGAAQEGIGNAARASVDFTQEKLGPIGAFNPLNLIENTPEAQSVRQGLTGRFSDEIAGILGGEQRAIDARAQADAFRQERPLAAGLTEGAGAIGGILAGGGAIRGAPGVAQIGAAAQKLPVSLRLAGGGAGTSAVFGAGGAQPGERQEEAAQSAAIGAVAGPVAGKAIGATGTLANAVSAPVRRAISRLTSKEARIVDQQIKNAPTIEQLKAQVDDTFSRARQQGVTATPKQTAELARTTDEILKRESLVTPRGDLLPNFPKIETAKKLIDDFADSPMTPSEMQNVREILQDAARSKTPKESRIGVRLLRHFDRFVEKQAPIFKQARPIFQRLKKAELIEDTSELALTRANARKNLDNALRTEFRPLLRNIKRGKVTGFSDEEIRAIEKIVEGSPLSNLAAKAGSISGPVGGGLGGLTGGAVGSAFGGPVTGAAVGAGVVGLGIGSRRLAGKLTMDAVDSASVLVRAGVAPKTVEALTIPQREALALLISAEISTDLADGSER